MFLTTRGRYATRAMLRLAIKHGGPPVPVGEIAEVEQVSEKYLQQLLGTLKRAGLARVVMGPHGGFGLARPPSEITIGAILRAVEGDIALTECLIHDGVCDRTPDCAARRLWCAGTRALQEFFDAQTLASAMQQPPCEEPAAPKRKKTAGSKVVSTASLVRRR